MTRAERLGLEPGSVDHLLDSDETWRAGRGSELRVATKAEIQHSIAISLRRIADQGDGSARARDETVQNVRAKRLCQLVSALSNSAGLPQGSRVAVGFDEFTALCAFADKEPGK